MKRKQPRWVQLDDLELWVRVCNCIKEARQAKADLTLPEIAEKVGKTLSAVSQGLRRLERRYSAGKLIERTPRVGVGRVTDLGRQLYREFKRHLRGLRDLEKDAAALKGSTEVKEKPARISIAATNSIRLSVCFAPIAAFQLWWSKRQASAERPELELRFEEGDYTEIIDAMRHSYDPYDFALGWQLPEGAFPDIDQSQVFLDSVEMVAIFPSQPFLTDERRHRDINEILKQSAANPGSSSREQFISFKTLQELAVGRPVATVRTEYYPKLRALLQNVDPIRQMVGSTYEDVLAYTRMGSADIGIVPEWFRDRDLVQVRRIDVGEGVPLTRSIVAYQPKESPGKITKPKKMRPYVQDLFDMLRAFLKMHSERILRRGEPKGMTEDMVNEFVDAWPSRNSEIPPA